MAEFYYRARTRLGAVTKGTIKAQSEERASQMLAEHGLVPLEIRDAHELSFWRRPRTFWSGVKVRDRAIFARQLATMIEAGIPVLQAIRILVQQTENARLSDILREVSYEVEGGGSLSSAVEKYPRVFSEFFVSMVRSGEASGRVAVSLHAVADHEEADADLTRKVRTALMYPAFIVVVLVVLAQVVTTIVLPQIALMFAEANVRLPIVTRVLLAVTNFFRAYWWFVLAFGGLAGYLFFSYMKTPEGRYNVSAVMLHLPLFGTFLRKLYLARFSGALRMLLNAEVPVVRALLIARDILTNRLYQTIIERTAEEVKNGSSIAASFEKYPEIPFMVSEMVRVGERSGQLGNSFGSINKFYQRDVEYALGNFTALIEPVVIVLVGIAVGFLLVAVLMPLYGLVQVIA